MSDNSPSQCPKCYGDNFHLVRSFIAGTRKPFIVSHYECDNPSCKAAFETQQESHLLGKPISQQWRGKSID